MTNWQAIVTEHKDLVWRTAYRLLGNEADASDCFQEAFAAAWKISRREPVNNWPGLLSRVTTHRALDALRKRLRYRGRFAGKVELDAQPTKLADPVQNAVAAELSEKLRVALATLPRQQAEAFSLRFVSDLSYTEIAAVLDVTENYVGVLLHRARAALRELLSSDAPEPDVEVSA